MHHLSEAEVIRQWSSINAHALEEGDDHPGFEPQLHIPAAAQWIRILGTQLRDEGITFGADEQRMARGGDLYDVDANGYGFTSVRWALWMDRFPHYSQDTRLSAEIRRIAAETADSMQWLVCSFSLVGKEGIPVFVPDGNNLSTRASHDTEWS
ncbi:hypothetical protein MPH_11919 [Macrophomina phaseolina MS6]|uniref:Uncharacterized protein n=1 Tax=Macrophomina phaseolina (strain MS6) TaxID=1126212 RepID=K2RD94_MACPH|nr:hypothetical protein MPH_11919 [Macrophomina phaseolina MS6]